MAERRGEQFGETRKAEIYKHPEWTLSTVFSIQWASQVSRGKKNNVFSLHLSVMKKPVCAQYCAQTLSYGNYMAWLNRKVPS